MSSRVHAVRTVFTDELINNAVILYGEGKTVEEIASALGVNKYSLAAYLRDRGVKLRGNSVDLTGSVIGNLTVVCLGEAGRNGHTRWVCECSCGSKKTVASTHLVRKNVTHCGCQARPVPGNFKGHGKVTKTYWNQVKKGAAGGYGRRPLEFTLTIEYISELFTLQDEKCCLTGLPISFRGKTASLDRIDSSKGYIEGNVQWVHKDINMMKRHYTHDYFIRLCNLVASKT